jgi:hypothetical protein
MDLNKAIFINFLVEFPLYNVLEWLTGSECFTFEILVATADGGIVYIVNMDFLSCKFV